MEGAAAAGEGVKVSFGFAKSKPSRPKQAVAGLGETEETEDADHQKAQGDAITEFTRAGATLAQPREAPKEVIIPLLKVNQWRTGDAETGAGTGVEGDEEPKAGVGKAATDVNDDDQRALAALQADADNVQQGETPADIDAIPLLMQNRAPGTERLDDAEKFKRDMQLRPAELSLQEYDRVPIEQFGTAMLRGMGWQKGEAIGGTNKGLVEPIEFVPRPSGLGLGATRDLSLKPDHRYQRKAINKPGETHREVAQLAGKVDASGKVRHIRGVSETLYEKEDLTVKRDRRVHIVQGPHRGQVGTITRMYNLMVDVRLASSDTVVACDESAVNVLPRAQARTVWAAIDKGYSPREALARAGIELPPTSSSKSGRDGSRKNDTSPRQSSEPPAKASKTSSRHRSSRHTWVVPDIRVRIVSQKYKKGKYYNVKAVVMDVLARDQITVSTEGRLLEDLYDSELETIVPRQPKAPVMVLRGEFAGQRARILERDSKQELVTVQLADGNVAACTFDDVSEYVGQSGFEDWE
ncbi:uncharacterized protein MONBRDRAFT_27691 [Monosiga brevicollis MX1]|uniref:G-patch domain-containing protein n=1 Tax=Monosiga brevicollis TaxID=81824 RepID=A9V613_MONBE|nr:uncharacterized protein MONBRDRAFT_27691 [Monosiga brevicollis MX1]EDQ86906.1 predicted protein [Monosiga brevicollis MX1]|eukprot:XP_001748145.1 hypothetical protein [Monosiga brevicollis MX1]